MQIRVQYAAGIVLVLIGLLIGISNLGARSWVIFIGNYADRR